MKKVQIFGSGCAKCQKLTDNAQKAAKLAGIDIELEKVSDMMEIMKLGILTTPGLAVDGKLIATGKLLSPEEIIPHLR